MSRVYFLDANIIMYAIGKDHALKKPCLRYLERIKTGEITVAASTEVLQEIMHRYVSLKMPLIAEEACAAVKDLCKEILPVTLSDIEKALGLLKTYPSINARDAVHAATMLNNGLGSILSADPHFDIIKGIKRIGP